MSYYVFVTHALRISVTFRKRKNESFMPCSVKKEIWSNLNYQTIILTNILYVYLNTE